MRRRALGLGLLLAAAGPVEPGLTLLVGAPPGTAADRWTRGFAPFLERHWARAAVGVANMAGEDGLAALRAVAEAPPDGGWIGAVATPALLAQAVAAGQDALLRRVAFLAAVAEEPVLLVGHPGTAGDLAALKALGPEAILGMPAAGTAAQLAGMRLARALALSGLGFASAAAARQAVVAGHIPSAMLPAPAAIAAIREGRLVALGVAQAARSPLLPEVPTLAEQSLPIAVLAQRGFVVPAGMRDALRDPLAGAMRAAVADPEFGAQAEASGHVPGFVGPPAWDRAIRAEAGLLARRWPADGWTGRGD